MNWNLDMYGNVTIMFHVVLLNDFSMKKPNHPTDRPKYAEIGHKGLNKQKKNILETVGIGGMSLVCLLFVLFFFLCFLLFLFFFLLVS